MSELARAVAPVRLNLLVPLVLGTLAGACFLVLAVVLGSITQARGPIEEHLPRIGSLMLASFGGMLVLFSAAWAVLYSWVVRPIQVLTGEAETLALTQQSRGLLMPSPPRPRTASARRRATGAEARRSARRDGRGDCGRHATRRGAEELARSDPARPDRRNYRLQSGAPHPALQPGRGAHSQHARRAGPRSVAVRPAHRRAGAADARTAAAGRAGGRENRARRG